MLYLSLDSCDSKKAGMSLLTCSRFTNAIPHTITTITTNAMFSGSVTSPHPLNHELLDAGAALRRNTLITCGAPGLRRGGGKRVLVGAHALQAACRLDTAGHPIHHDHASA